MYRKSILMLIFSLLFTMTVMVVAVPQEATAAGMTVYADLAEDANYNDTGGITFATPSTWPEMPISGAGASDDVFVSWVSSAEFASDDTVTFTLPSGWTVSSNCLSAAGDTNDADANGTDDGGFRAPSGTSITYAFDSDGTAQATTAVEFCLRLTNPGYATNHAVIITTSGTVDDFGGALIYVGDDNDVTVTANVTPVLRFEIRDDADTAYTNACDLGYLTTTATSECKYRLKVYTNASNGYTVKITTNGDLSRGGTGDVVDADDLDPATNDEQLVYDNEGYGASLDANACTYGSAATEVGTWDTDFSPLPSSDVINDLYSCAGVNLPEATDLTNTAEMVHVAAIDSGTQSGNYTQIVTYYVIADF